MCNSLIAGVVNDQGNAVRAWKHDAMELSIMGAQKVTAEPAESLVIRRSVITPFMNGV